MYLYELSNEYAALQEALGNGVDSEEEFDELLKQMEGLEEEFEDKAEAYARICVNLTAQAKAIKDEEDRLYARRVALENNVKRLKESLNNGMVLFGKRKVPTSIGNWSIQRNPPSVRVLDATRVPSQYWTCPQPTISRTLILEALKRGEAVDGCELQQTEGLRFR